MAEIEVLFWVPLDWRLSIERRKGTGDSSPGGGDTWVLCQSVLGFGRRGRR